jgi:hypothetical protein
MDDDATRKVNALIDRVQTLLDDVCEERRRLHRERHAVFQIVLEGGHLPSLHRLADLLEQQERPQGLN